MARFMVSHSAGQRDGNRYAVLDTQDRQGGKGIRRVAFYKTLARAQKEAKRLNEIDRAGEVFFDTFHSRPGG